MTSVVTNDNSNPQQGTPFQAYPPTPRRMFKVPPNKKDHRKLFVGGLPANITEDEFREFFEQFGKLVDSVVMFDRDTRRSRGFGFVTFEDPIVARNLLMMGNEGEDPDRAMQLVGKLEMQGKMCEVKAATPREGGGRGRKDVAKRMDGYAGHMGGPQPPAGQNMMYGYPVGMMPPNAYYAPQQFVPPAYPAGFVDYPPVPLGVEQRTADPHIPAPILNSTPGNIAAGGGGGGPGAMFSPPVGMPVVPIAYGGVPLPQSQQPGMYLAHPPQEPGYDANEEQP